LCTFLTLFKLISDRGVRHPSLYAKKRVQLETELYTYKDSRFVA